MDALGIEWPLLFSQLVNFLILIVLLRMFLYKPVLNMSTHARTASLRA